MRFKEELYKILFFLFFTTLSGSIYTAEPVMGGKKNYELKEEIIAENLALENSRKSKEKSRLPASVEAPKKSKQK